MPRWCFWSVSAPRRQEQALRRVRLVARRLRRANSQEPGGHKGPPGAAASSSASVLSRTDQSLDKEALARLAAAASRVNPFYWHRCGESAILVAKGYGSRARSAPACEPLMRIRVKT